MDLGKYRSSWGKPLIAAAVIFYFMHINRLFQGTTPQIVLHVVIWLSFSCFMFIPKLWWTPARVWSVAGVIVAESVVGMVWLRETNMVYFIATVVFAALIRLSISKTSILTIAVMGMTAVLYSLYGSDDLFNILTFAGLAVVFYFSIRSRMQRNEAYERDRRHLAELQEAYKLLQEASAEAMRSAVLEERSRIARDIHDAVGHSLTSLIVQMQALRYMIRRDPGQAEQSVEGMLAVSRQGLHDIRSSVHALAEDRSVSGIMSLQALLTRMETTASIRYTFRSDLIEGDGTTAIYAALFRVLQEAATNIIRHSQANWVEVRLKRESDNIVMVIRDNGVLKSDRPIVEGFGFRTMTSRLEEAGGRLRYSILEPHGFELIAELPDPSIGEDG